MLPAFFRSSISRFQAGRATSATAGDAAGPPSPAPPVRLWLGAVTAVGLAVSLGLTADCVVEPAGPMGAVAGGSVAELAADTPGLPAIEAIDGPPLVGGGAPELRENGAAAAGGVAWGPNRLARPLPTTTLTPGPAAGEDNAAAAGVVCSFATDKAGVPEAGLVVFAAGTELGGGVDAVTALDGGGIGAEAVGTFCACEVSRLVCDLGDKAVAAGLWDLGGLNVAAVGGGAAWLAGGI